MYTCTCPYVYMHFIIIRMIVYSARRPPRRRADRNTFNVMYFTREIYVVPNLPRPDATVFLSRSTTTTVRGVAPPARRAIIILRAHVDDVYTTRNNGRSLYTSVSYDLVYARRIVIIGKLVNCFSSPPPRTKSFKNKIFSLFAALLTLRVHRARRHIASAYGVQ